MKGTEYFKIILKVQVPWINSACRYRCFLHVSKHRLVSTADPTQLAPPLAGVGLSHALIRLCIPHVSAEHASHGSKSPHPPSTGPHIFLHLAISASSNLWHLLTKYRVILNFVSYDWSETHSKVVSKPETNFIRISCEPVLQTIFREIHFKVKEHPRTTKQGNVFVTLLYQYRFLLPCFQPPISQYQLSKPKAEGAVPE